MFAEAVIFYGGFVWYESQFDYVSTDSQEVNVETSGENANEEYNDNDVQGNQYNDNAVHNEGGEQ